MNSTPPNCPTLFFFQTGVFSIFNQGISMIMKREVERFAEPRLKWFPSQGASDMGLDFFGLTWMSYTTNNRFACDLNSYKQRVLMHGHQGWNVRHGLCHIYMRYVYIWVVYSFCLFCCLFILVTWWYVWCIEWTSGNQEEVQACLVTLCLFIISCYSLYKTTLGLLCSWFENNPYFHKYSTDFHV